MRSTFKGWRTHTRDEFSSCGRYGFGIVEKPGVGVLCLGKETFVNTTGIAMSKSCGSCQHFQKWKNDKFSGGVCLLLDWRTNTDHGRGCKHHKRIPYDRESHKLNTLREINMESSHD